MTKFKRDLKVWNKKVFGDVFLRLEASKKTHESIQIDIATNGFTEDKHEVEILALFDYNIALNVD